MDDNLGSRRHFSIEVIMVSVFHSFHIFVINRPQPPFNSSHIMKTLQDPEPGQLPYTYPMTNYEVYRLRGKSPWRKGGPRKCGFIHGSRALFSELLRLL